jgi:hypothetical protein
MSKQQFVVIGFSEVRQKHSERIVRAGRAALHVSDNECYHNGGANDWQHASRSQRSLYRDIERPTADPYLGCFHSWSGLGTRSNPELLGSVNLSAPPGQESGRGASEFKKGFNDPPFIGHVRFAQTALQPKAN